MALALVLAPSAHAFPVRSSFTPTDPLVSHQYYLGQDHAFDAFGPELPVVVTMDFWAQVQSYVMSQQYESLLTKAKFKG